MKIILNVSHYAFAAAIKGCSDDKRRSVGNPKFPYSELFPEHVWQQLPQNQETLLEDTKNARQEFVRYVHKAYRRIFPAADSNGQFAGQPTHLRHTNVEQGLSAIGRCVKCHSSRTGEVGHAPLIPFGDTMKLKVWLQKPGKHQLLKQKVTSGAMPMNSTLDLEERHAVLEAMEVLISERE